MSHVIQDLHEDHVNFSKLLGVLSEKLKVLKASGLPDFHLMLDAVDYLEHYGDLYHHPKEDAVYQFHLQGSTEAHDAIDDLMQQHKDLKLMTAQLCRAIDGILHGTILLKETFIEQLSDYLNAQQRHMDLEESQVFPLLRRTLTEQDWSKIEALMPPRRDPLFGSQVAEKYQNLYARIAETPL